MISHGIQEKSRLSHDSDYLSLFSHNFDKTTRLYHVDYKISMISHGILEKRCLSHDCEIVADDNGCGHVENQ